MHNLALEFERLNIINIQRLQSFYPRVRDRDDISVLRDPVTNVIMLSSSEHMSSRYYEEKQEQAGYVVQESIVESPSLPDDLRRAEEFGSLLHGKRWLDFGCGLGGLLHAMQRRPIQAQGLEPSKERAAIAGSKGHSIVCNLDQVPVQSLDIITMFHVLEHLTTPLQTLIQIRDCLRPGGTLLIEVPHARDALFTLYDCEAFKRFTFWSEHLVLHTRQSLEILLAHAGFSQIQVSGRQRYPLSNHLHWLVRQKPGGHDAWALLNSAGLHSEYEAMLSRLDRTDTLIATTRVPEKQ